MSYEKEIDQTSESFKAEGRRKMTLEELKHILSQGEGNTIEYKEAQRGVPVSLYETVVSFSNTDGGVLVLGADDDGNVIGIPSENLSKYSQEIVSSLNNPDCIKPSLYLEPVPVEHEDGLVLILRVPATSQLHRYNGRVYWRSDDNDQDITSDQQKISDIYFRKRNYFSESIIYKFLSYKDLDEQLFDKARSIINSRDSNHPWLMMGNREILSSSSLFRKDFKTGEEGLTLAAALIFGKDETIHNLLPGYKVEALVRKDNLDRYDDRLPPLRTNLIDTYIKLLAFVKEHLEDKFYQEGEQRKDLRELIFREVIGNLIVHREYTSALSSELIIYKDKVTVTNPNKALFHGPLNLHKFTPYPKNPNIRKFFTAFGWTDELGSGIRNTTKYLNIYVPGAKPAFIEDDTFLTEIPLVFRSLFIYHKEFCNWLGFSEKTTELLKDNFTLLDLPSELSGLTWAELILHLVPSWNKKGTRLKELNWPKNQLVEIEEIKKVLGWQKKSTKLIHKKVAYMIKILLLSVKPISLNDLMAHIDYSNRKTFRENYLRPLQEVQFIEKTEKIAVSSPEQKYFITEQGKRFLTGKTEL